MSGLPGNDITHLPHLPFLSCPRWVNIQFSYYGKRLILLNDHKYGREKKEVKFRIWIYIWIIFEDRFYTFIIIAIFSFHNLRNKVIQYMDGTSNLKSVRTS